MVRSRRFFYVILLMVLIAVGYQVPASAQDTAPYWPTDGWRTSSPEAQGMDSGRLAAMLAYIEDEDINIHSVLVVRHGYLVTEAYRYPYQPETLHSLQSCTKSIVSALVGIAIQQGAIDGVDQHVVDLFPERTIDRLDDTKRAMTVEHLLTMQSGLTEADSEEIWQGDNLTQALLDLPMSAEPGTRFVYSGIASQLLAEIVAETTGMSTLDFATQNLFEPLGIQETLWETVVPGHVNAGAGLWLTPRDMAKVGYLYLRDGQWEDTQILPPGWAAASATPHVDSPRMVDTQIADGYGYQWWVDGAGYYMALGAGGQTIFVQPDLDLVAVLTSGLVTDDGIPVGLFEAFILPAVESQQPLPENPEKQGELETQILALAQPESVPVPSLPATAYRISDQTYVLEDNTLGWSSLALHFNQDALEEATVIVNDIRWRVGLDGVFRVNDNEQSLPFLLKGRWITDDSFEMNWEALGSPYPIRVLLRFEDTTVRGRAWYHGYEEATWRFTGVAED
jgi:CubicO group peptidase (beta-lactamase class C family)